MYVYAYIHVHTYVHMYISACVPCIYVDTYAYVYAYACAHALEGPLPSKPEGQLWKAPAATANAVRLRPRSTGGRFLGSST